MNKAFKSFIAVSIVVTFVVTAIICCCVVKEALAGLKKQACSHCTTKDTADAGSHQCCFSKASPMEIAKQEGVSGLLPLLICVVLISFYFKPSVQLAYRRYQNGPPGYVASVPIYLRFRSIRI